MSGLFLSPVFLWFLAAIPPVILLYILKLRRTEVVISSTMLWLRSLQDLTANAPFQRLRRNLLLLLQILILTALAVALARPYVQAAGSPGKNLCILIDNSASMLTAEENGTRMDEAKKAVRELIDTMRGGDRIMLIAFADKAEVLTELTEDRFRLRQALDGIEPVPTATRIRDAVLVARSLKGATREAPIIGDLRLLVVSDGNIADLAEAAAKASDVDYVRIGSTRNNAGIAAFSVRAPADGSADQRQAFLLLRNDAEEPVATTLTLTLDDEIVAVEEVAIPARDDLELAFAAGSLGEGILRAELDVDDALAVDDTAWLALQPDAKLRVLLVSAGDSTGGYFLKRVLMLEPRVELSSIAPESYASGSGHDLVIFDGFAPAALPDGASLFINAAPPLDEVALGEVVENPPVLSTNSDHPLMRFLNPANVGISKARTLTIPPDAKELVTTNGGPLIADVSRQGKQVVVAAFDLADSNWPLHLSFPLFVQNLLAWAPRAALSEETSIRAGEPIALLPQGDALQAVVAAPDGRTSTVELSALRPSFFGDTHQLGIYTVTRGADTTRYAVNLLNPEETLVAPKDSILFGRSEVTAETDGAKQNREYWRWLVAAAIAILAVEWWIYTRRAWM